MDSPNERTPAIGRGFEGQLATGQAQGEFTAEPAKVELSVFTSDTRLSKRFEMRGTKLVKFPGGEMGSGFVEVRGVRSARELADLILSLTPTQALGYGVPRSGLKSAPITTKGNPLLGAIARSGKNFGWSEGPGIFMIDYDPAPGTEPLTEAKFYAKILEVCPQIDQAPSVLMSSASSYIYDDMTNRQLIGARGLRLLVFVRDGRDIRRAGNALSEMLRLRGHGYARISKAGSLLNRNLIDEDVWGPERLDFVGGANCEGGLEQRRPRPIVRNSKCDPLDTAAALPDLTPEERERLPALMAAAKAAVAGEAAIVRAAWVERRAEAWAEKNREKLSGMNESEASAAREVARATFAKAAETHVLQGDFEIVLADGRVVTVAEILTNPAAFHGLRCADPLEPDYGNDPRIGLINTESATPTIYSHAHGGQKYALVDPRDPADDFTALNVDPFGSFVSPLDGTFPKIRKLPDPLPPVPKLDPELIPKNLRAWVREQADGLQVPLEFCAVPAIVAAASVIGRQVGVALKQHERWIERCIIWGAVIGRPSTLKSPALRPAQRMLAKLERRRRELWELQNSDSGLSEVLNDAERNLAKTEAKKLLKAGDKTGARKVLEAVEADGEESPEPRLVVNDATVEKLGEILNGNPRGLIQFRDELAGWLASLDKDGREGDRGFWLECWNGHGPYTCDRIGRGTVRIEAPAVSILGGIQPGKLAEYVRGAVKGGMADDGLLQRFQMAVYPDVPASWQFVDRAPSPDAEVDATSLFERLDRLDPDLIDAERHSTVDVPYLRLDPDAQSMFIEWQTTLMHRLRSGGEPPYMEAHLAKYPALVGRLALTLHLCDHDRGPVGIDALAMSIRWCEFLEPHARRMYAPATDNGIGAAHLLLKRRNELPDRFTQRELYRRGWAGLDSESVRQAVDLLVEYGHLIEFQQDTGGRPTTTYEWRPAP